ncbi:MAG: hypothetical protein CVV46_16655 [Spirochaetae bacterium HGW-Spirochaetae-2]|jgi:hypothetical protein|nr:MAG: hypothetical protein CVV46_16655 [Spirochaetae bacterium HGW-Spirochaetae-2]PKL68508.1 MAG: hypothetical protein CVV30_11410 [Methanomicrobiales archaeon HGW-Methanomicrobiales-1]
MTARIPAQKPRTCPAPAQTILIVLVVLIALVPAVQCTDTNITDKTTNCQNRFNLAPENKIQISVPTVVDIDVKTGNLLVRGQIPLVVRDGAGNTKGCRMLADWTYSYDGLNTLMQDKKGFVPAYFNAQNKNDEKIAAIHAAMANFNLDDYEVIDISLLNSNPEGNDMVEFETIQKAFGGVSSTCNATLVDTTFHGRNGNAVLSDFYFCNPKDGGNDPDCIQSIVMDNVNPGSCSYSGRIDQIIALLAGKDQKPGTKRLIYYHCSQGSDRTGSVTMGYLQKTIPGISYVHALHYAQYLGQEEQGSGANWLVGYGANTSALAYCRYIGADCTQTENSRIMLPGSTTHAHLPGQADTTVAPTPTQAPAGVATPVPSQTPMPTKPYNPTKTGDVNF